MEIFGAGFPWDPFPQLVGPEANPVSPNHSLPLPLWYLRGLSPRLWFGLWNSWEMGCCWPAKPVLSSCLVAGPTLWFRIRVHWLFFWTSPLLKATEAPTAGTHSQHNAIALHYFPHIIPHIQPPSLLMQSSYVMLLKVSWLILQVSCEFSWLLAMSLGPLWDYGSITDANDFWYSKKNPCILFWSRNGSQEKTILDNLKTEAHTWHRIILYLHLIRWNHTCKLQCLLFCAWKIWPAHRGQKLCSCALFILTQVLFPHIYIFKKCSLHPYPSYLPCRHMWIEWGGLKEGSRCQIGADLIIRQRATMPPVAYVGGNSSNPCSCSSVVMSSGIAWGCQSGSLHGAQYF